MRLDPRAKLASIAAMAVAVALAPNMLCDFALMGFAFAFGSMLGQLRVSAAMLVLYALFITLAQFVPYLYDVGLRTIFSSFLLLMRKVFACGLMAYATVKTTHIDEGFPILLHTFPCTASHLFPCPFTASPLSKCRTHQ